MPLRKWSRRDATGLSRSHALSFSGALSRSPPPRSLARALSLARSFSLSLVRPPFVLLALPLSRSRSLSLSRSLTLPRALSLLLTRARSLSLSVRMCCVALPACVCVCARMRITRAYCSESARQRDALDSGALCQRLVALACSSGVR